ncbi:MAG: hypothetical protein EAZ12_00745 [Sphingobacteriia bacterium]|nr:MAG: hypothetical protein EAZ12_00745 [Sphingobacteriia bacterium]
MGKVFYYHFGHVTHRTHTSTFAISGALKICLPLLNFFVESKFPFLSYSLKRMILLVQNLPLPYVN